MLLIALIRHLQYQGLTCFKRHIRWKLEGKVKLVTKQINDRSNIPDFHSNMTTGEFLTLQDQMPVLMIAATLVIQKFHSGFTYTGVNKENKGIN